MEIYLTWVKGPSYFDLVPHPPDTKLAFLRFFLRYYSYLVCSI